MPLPPIECNWDHYRENLDAGTTRLTVYQAMGTLCSRCKRPRQVVLMVAQNGATLEGARLPCLCFSCITQLFGEYHRTHPKGADLFDWVRPPDL